MIVSGCVNALLGMAQFWDWLDVNTRYTPLLGVADDTMGTAGYRVGGGLGNPNYFGMVLVWHAGYLVAYRHLPDRGAVKRSAAWLAVAGISVAVVLTQSRTTILAMCVITLAAVGVSFHGSPLKGIRTAVAILCVGFCAFAIIGTPGEAARVDLQRLDLKSDSTERSASGRWRDFVVPVLHAMDNPWLLPFGQGPSKQTLRTDSHNGYTWILQRFGVVGLGVYVSMIAFLMSNAIRAFRRYRGGLGKLAGWGGFAAGLTWIIFEIPANVFKDPACMTLCMISAGWVAAACDQSQATRPPATPARWTGGGLL